MQKQMAATGASKGAYCSQVSCAELMAQGFDATEEEMNETAVNISLLNEDGGFLDLEELAVCPATFATADERSYQMTKLRKHDASDRHSAELAAATVSQLCDEDNDQDHIDDASDEESAELSAAAAAVSPMDDACDMDNDVDDIDDASDEQSAEVAAAAAMSPVGDAFDSDKDEDDIDIDRGTIDILDTPKFNIDRMSCLTTPASLVSWNLDVDDTLSLLDVDLSQDDDDVFLDDADLVTESKLKNPANECYDEAAGIEEFPGGDVGSSSVEKEKKLQQLEKQRGRKENRGNVSMSAVVKVTSGSPESVTAVPPSQWLYTQQSSDVSSDSQTAGNDLVYQKYVACSMQSETKTDEAITAIQHSQSSQPHTTAAIGERERDQYLARKSLRLSRQNQMKTHAAVSMVEVETDAEPQLLQTDDDEKELESKPVRRSGSKKKQRTHAEKSIGQTLSVDSSVQDTGKWDQNLARKRLRQSQQKVLKANAAVALAEVETDTLHNVDKEFEPKPERRSLSSCVQQKKQIAQMEKSVSHSSSTDSSVQDTGDWDQNSGRKRLRLSGQKHQVKVNDAEVETGTEPQLLQADTETLHYVDKEPKPERRSLRRRRQQKKQIIQTEKINSQTSNVDRSITDTGEWDEKLARQSLRQSRQKQTKATDAVSVEVETDAEQQLLQTDAETLHVDKECEPEPARRSCAQQKTLIAQIEKSVSQSSNTDGSVEDTSVFTSSQREDMTYASATENSNKKQLKTKLIRQNSDKQQQNQSEQCQNQTTNMSIVKPDTRLNLSPFQQAVATQRSVSESTPDEDKQLKPKSMQKSLKSHRQQLKKPSDKSAGVKPRRKLYSTNSMLYQQADETSEQLTVDGRNSSQAADVNIELFNGTEYGNPEAISRVKTDKNTIEYNNDHLTVSTSSCVQADSPVHDMPIVPCENDAASLIMQPILGDATEDVMSNQQITSLARSQYCEEMITSSPAEFSCSQNEILSNQLVAATDANAVDIFRYNTDANNDQEQNTDTALVNVTAETAATGQNIVTVKHADKKISRSTASSNDLCVDVSSSLLNSQTVASRPQKQKSSAVGCADHFSRVVTTGHAEVSHASSTGCFYAKSVMMKPTVCSSQTTEAEQRMNEVMSVISVDLNNEDEQGDEDASNLHQYPCTNSDIHVSRQVTAYQNVPQITSGEFAHIFPPVDRLHSTQMHSREGKLHTASNASERVHKMEDQVTDDSESQLVTSQQRRQQKCSVAASQFAGCFSSQNAGPVLQMQQQGVQKIHEAVGYSGSEVNKQAACASREDPDPVASHRESSQKPAFQQCHRQKCSVADYSFSSHCAQNVCETEEQVLTAGVDCSSPEVDEIPNSLPDIYSQIHSNRKKQAAYANEQDSEFSQTAASQQRHQQKCSIAASEYNVGLHAAQNWHETHEQVAGVEYSSPEVNEIPGSLPLTHCHGHYQKQTMHKGSSLAPVESQQMAAFCGQYFLPGADAHGNRSNLPVPRLCSTDTAVYGDGIEINAYNSDVHDGGSDANATGANFQRRAKVSRPRQTWVHASEHQADAHQVDDERSQCTKLSKKRR